MVLLLQAVREAFDAYRQLLSSLYHFTLTVACLASPSNYQQLHLAKMNQYVDFWNLMAFDYTGPWSTLTGDQANLFSSTSNPNSTPFNTQATVNYYILQRIKASKIVLRMPIYSQSFEATNSLRMLFSSIS